MAKQKRYNGYLRKSFRVEGCDKRFYIYGKNAEELRQAENKKRAEIANGLRALYNPTLSEYYKHFTQEREKEVKGATIRAQVIQFELVASVELADGVKVGDMPIKDISRRHVTDARSILLSQGKTPQHLNICFKHLNHVFNYAVSDDVIDKNPIARLPELKREAETINETKHRALSQEETIKFFNAARARNSIYLNDFLFMINSGVRIGELAALTIKDVDEKAGYIHIKRTVTRDAVGGYIIGSDAKTKSGKRDIPLTEELIKIICEQQELNKMLYGLNINDLTLFKSAEGELLKEYTLNREIKRICTAAGIEYFTCHCFRNTFATRYIEARPQDFKILSEILGHKSIDITLNLYTHVMAEQKENSMKAIQIKTS